MTTLVAASSPWWLEQYERFLAWRLARPVARQAFPKLSPFTRVSVSGRAAIVEFEGEEYELLKVEGIPTDRLMRVAEIVYEDRAEKRFREDLVELLNAAGKKVGSSVSLNLQSVETGEVRSVANAPMTHENRQVVYGQTELDSDSMALLRRLESAKK